MKTNKVKKLIRLTCPHCKAKLKEFGLCFDSSSHYNAAIDDKNGQLDFGLSEQGDDGDLDYITCSECHEWWEPTAKDKKLLGY